MEMGNVSKRQQPDHRTDNWRRSQTGLHCNEKFPHQEASFSWSLNKYICLQAKLPTQTFFQYKNNLNHCAFCRGNLQCFYEFSTNIFLFLGINQYIMVQISSNVLHKFSLMYRFLNILLVKSSTCQPLTDETDICSTPVQLSYNIYCYQLCNKTKPETNLQQKIQNLKKKLVVSKKDTNSKLLFRYFHISNLF